MARVEADIAGFEGEAHIRVPANVMGMLREAYGSREKTLDWMLAAVAIGTLAWAFWPQFRNGFGAKGIPGDVNTGRQGNLVPNTDFSTAFPTRNGIVNPANVLTYNMPPSRKLDNNRGPSMFQVPTNPNAGGRYSSLDPVPEI